MAPGASPASASDSAPTAASQYAAALAAQSSALPAVSTSLDPEACLEAGKALAGRVVIVTGAASGFGRAYALKAASFGAKVVLSDLQLGPVEEVMKEIQGAGGCDTTSWDEQMAMFKHARKTYGHIDVVFPNAGVGETGEWLKDLKTPSGDPVKPSFLTLEVNLIGAAYTTKLAFYHLRQNPSKSKKSIVFIGSMSSFIGIPQGPVYSMTKHGILGLFRSVYYNGEADGINTNIVCPWFTDTGILAPMNRLAVLGLPLCKIEDVVAAVIRSSADEAFSGNMLSIDAQGILCIPFEAFGAGTEGYYKAFGDRAIFSINLERTLKDVGLLVRQTVRFWMKGKKTQVLSLGLLFVLLRLKWGKSRGP